MASKKLVAPKNLRIDFSPSPKQYELWKLLQPECPLCGGEIVQVLTGYDANHNTKYKPHCKRCGNANIPQLVLGGGAAGKRLLCQPAQQCAVNNFLNCREP